MPLKLMGVGISLHSIDVSKQDVDLVRGNLRKPGNPIIFGGHAKILKTF